MSVHQQIGDAFTYMSYDMRGKLGNYMTSLEHRYGDPAVYAAQREEMAAEQAQIVHTQVKSREDVLSAAYSQSRDQIRKGHTTRMQNFARDKPPQYLVPDQPDQTPEPPEPERPRPPAKARGQRRANAR